MVVVVITILIMSLLLLTADVNLFTQNRDQNFISFQEYVIYRGG